MEDVRRRRVQFQRILKTNSQFIESFLDCNRKYAEFRRLGREQIRFLENVLRKQVRESGESRSGIMSLLVSFKKKPKIGRGTLLGHPRGQLQRQLQQQSTQLQEFATARTSYDPPQRSSHMFVRVDDSDNDGPQPKRPR